MIQSYLRNLRPLSLLLLMCMLIFFLVGCNQRPRVIVEGGTAPLFSISGNGSIQVVTVSGPDFENRKSRDAGSRYMKPYWQIVAQTEEGSSRINRLKRIDYGKVPDGFKQVFPANGVAPQPLVENELFTVDLRLENGEAVGKRFVIHAGKAAVEGS